MKQILILLFLFKFSTYAQNSVDISHVKTTTFKADNIVSIDDFGTVYYILNNVFYKKTRTQTISYNNLQLGDVAAVNAFNPLKINLFYKDFNTTIILDNRLAEIFKIDFNTIQPYKNITHISSGFDNTFWVFNQDSQQLELYNYKNNTTQARTVPIQSKVLDLKSNYNSVWLLSEKYLYEYNYFGNLLRKTKNNGYTQLSEDHGILILIKDNNLYFLKKDWSETIPINLPNLLINQFFVTNETLYIYQNQKLQQFQLKIN
ncbi:hypothetical protein [Seonamhaeicola aphaedonensis]|uniref:Uncharacterized protein n=1 Tax=Seonamhaeicola aphaedonensis TaxID=1461338 RepID=A0A3D9HLM3_9FLAO|nr:hypothetical protein [Seonamhaeicola aphaedonensis]RED50389.1 hypothetical protein DFQ02_101419 [Seonamhaeicola aphaedonensis]